jgi:general secretion pathway protein C
MLDSLSPPDHERLSRFAALGVAAAAAAACLYLLVRLAWLAVPLPEGPAAPHSVAPAAVDAATSIAKWHLFGNPQPMAQAPASALATVLKLGLRGTLALPDPKDERAVAIIANEQGAETNYRIGDAVAPGATLAEVHTDHVVLDHQGVAETLTLPRPEQHAPPLPDRNQQALHGGSAAASSIPPGIAKPAPASAPASTPAQRIDAQEFARQIRPKFTDDGHLVGADISGADASTLARVGLKPSDVVTAINGTPLTQVANPQALMDQLQNAGSIQVTVQRDGKPATLTLSLR